MNTSSNMIKYQICTNCVMDTTDPLIHFDEAGRCNHCRNFEDVIKPLWKPNAQGQALLQQKAEEIRSYGSKKEYDCIIGVSGGVDSSYLLYVAKEMMNLRPLAVHVDAGWNSELAVRNIENLTKGLGIDLFTYVVDWPEMRDLQVAYLKSSVANQDVPQDHVFFAKLYEFAIDKDIRYVLTGSNFATESILPRSWGYNAKDSKQLRAIHKRFGKRPLKTFPISGLFRSYIYYPYIRRIKIVTPLNDIPYNKDEAIRFLSERFGWVYYGGKHFESRWTKFFQSYYLPTKFGYDKRRAHLASLVVSGQMTREAALQELAAPPYDASTIEADKEFISKKLGLKVGELDELIKLPNRDFSYYPNSSAFEGFLRSCKYFLLGLKKFFSLRTVTKGA